MMLHTCRSTSTAQNAIVVTADLRYVCNIVQLLHAPCPFSARTLHKCVRVIWAAVAEWVTVECWTGDRIDLRSSPPAATYSLRNFSNSVYPALPVPFGGDTKSRRSLLLGVYARGSKRSHQSALDMCNVSWTSPLLNKCDYTEENSALH